MTAIRRAIIHDCQLLADIGKQSFIESHGHSAPEADIAAYVNAKYTPGECEAELSNLENIYDFIYHDQQPAGYSKIILNSPHTNISVPAVTKLERLYLLEAFYNLQLGRTLFDHAVTLSKENGQAGMWLFVWKENERAVNFYKKNGFVIVGSYDFKISASHSNPNHQMYLQY